MVINSQGSAVYNQTFHSGVNIIRGENGSGKSTIIDFIYYVLGGDITEWKPEANDCDEVVAEVNINEAVLTLKRYVSNSSRQPMQIFWGPISEAEKSAITGWQKYSFQRSREKESFSQVLFRAIELPEVRNDIDSNITMHQLLRLIYVDQLSPIDSLLRTEQFDTSLTRETIGDLLLGIYDDSVYDAELALRNKRRELDNEKVEYRNIINIFNETNQEINIETIDSNILTIKETIQQITYNIRELEVVKDIKDIELSKLIEEIRMNLLSSKRKRVEIESKINSLDFEIGDTADFITSLSGRINALDQSITTKDNLGELQLRNCPLCLKPIVNSELDGVCPLCQQTIEGSHPHTHALRMKQEIAFQIKESKVIYNTMIADRNELKSKLPTIINNEWEMQRKYDEIYNEVNTSRYQSINILVDKRGVLFGEINTLNRQKEALSVVGKLKENILQLTDEINRLEMYINVKRKEQEHKREIALNKIEEIALYILSNDLHREDIFRFGTSAKLYFDKNTFSVNDRNQFSASSMALLKNAIHFAIFFASLEFDFIRYPRFIICDNMEDKGMEMVRSHNFQKLIVNMAINYNVNHQIIFTTSMIDPDLNNTELCVGPEYSRDNKSLRMNTE
jgi:hypothetical protein